jgi:hypothetical protein
MPGIIMQCNCTHEFQDKTYGYRMRVHNLSPDGKKAYCTVCSPSNRRNKEQFRPSRNPKFVSS